MLRGRSSHAIGTTFEFTKHICRLILLSSQRGVAKETFWLQLNSSVFLELQNRRNYAHIVRIPHNLCQDSVKKATEMHSIIKQVSNITEQLEERASVTRRRGEVHRASVWYVRGTQVETWLSRTFSWLCWMLVGTRGRLAMPSTKVKGSGTWWCLLSISNIRT